MGTFLKADLLFFLNSDIPNNYGILHIYVSCTFLYAHLMWQGHRKSRSLLI